MYFLKIDFNLHEAKPDSIELDSGLNIVFAEQSSRISSLLDVLTDTVCGESEEGNSGDSGSCRILLSMADLEFDITSDQISTDYKGTEPETDEHQKALSDYRTIFSRHSFISTSIIDMSGQIKNTDITRSVPAIKEILLNEQLLNGSINIIRNEKNLKKQIADADKELQLLEIKSLRKEKLKREIDSVNRIISKLIKKKSSLTEYLDTLGRIHILLKEKENLDSERDRLKGNIIKLDELIKRIKSIEEDVNLKFPHLRDKLSGDEDNLDRIQGLFNSIRDISGRVDSYFSNRRVILSRMKKYISAIAVSALIVTTFLLYKSAGDRSAVEFPLYITGITLFCIAVIIFYQSLHAVKKMYPEELIEEKRTMEKELFDYMEQSSFEMEDYKTGELYEFLLQYFEDFIKFNDLKSEITELRKMMNSQTDISEEKKNLDSVVIKLRETEEKINSEIKKINDKLHPLPDFHKIEDAVHEIKDILSETEIEINQEKTIYENINNEIKKYGSEEDLSFTEKADKIGEKISTLQKELDALTFISSTLKKSADSWLSSHLEELIDRTDEVFETISSNEQREKYDRQMIEKIITSETEESYNEISEGLILSLSTAMAYLMKDSPFLPPLIIIPPSDSDDSKIVDQLNKIVLELSGIRQVIIFTSRRMSLDHGKQITI